MTINKEKSVLLQRVEMLKIDKEESIERSEAQKKIYESIISAYESGEKVKRNIFNIVDQKAKYSTPSSNQEASKPKRKNSSENIKLSRQLEKLTNLLSDFNNFQTTSSESSSKRIEKEEIIHDAIRNITMEKDAKINSLKAKCDMLKRENENYKQKLMLKTK